MTNSHIWVSKFDQDFYKQLSSFGLKIFSLLLFRFATGKIFAITGSVAATQNTRLMFFPLQFSLSQ